MLFAVFLSISFASAIGSYPSVNESMVLYYHFNNNSLIGENDTFIVDSSGKGNNGTVINATWNNTGGYLGDGAFEFNGTTDSIQIPFSNSLNITNNFTLALWFKKSLGDVNNRDIISKWTVSGNFSWGLSTASAFSNCVLRFIISSNGTNTLYQNNNLFTSSYTVCDGNWHYVLITYDGVNVTTYLDSLAPISSSYTSGIFESGTEIKVSYNTISSNRWNGSIDEVIIWNKSLSSDEEYLIYDSYTANCIVPTDGITISRNKIICSPNNFSFNGSANGVIQFNSNSVLDCNYSSFTGNATSEIRFINLVSKSNITLKNCILNNYYTTGRFSSTGTDIKLINITVNKNVGKAFDIINSIT